MAVGAGFGSGLRLGGGFGSGVRSGVGCGFGLRQDFGCGHRGAPFGQCGEFGQRGIGERREVDRRIVAGRAVVRRRGAARGAGGVRAVALRVVCACRAFCGCARSGLRLPPVRIQVRQREEDRVEVGCDRAARHHLALEPPPAFRIGFVRAFDLLHRIAPDAAGQPLQRLLFKRVALRLAGRGLRFGFDGCCFRYGCLRNFCIRVSRFGDSFARKCLPRSAACGGGSAGRFRFAGKGPVFGQLPPFGQLQVPGSCHAGIYKI